MKELKKLILMILKGYISGEVIAGGVYEPAIGGLSFEDIADDIISRSSLINASGKMLEALQNLENDENQIPDRAWKMVEDAIILAVPDYKRKNLNMKKEEIVECASCKHVGKAFYLTPCINCRAIMGGDVINSHYER